MSKAAIDSALSASDFALPEDKVLPCDTPDMLKLSSCAFDAGHERLSAAKKRAAAKHIAKRASEMGVDISGSVAARISGGSLNPEFEACLWSRRDLVYAKNRNEDALSVLSKIAANIESSPYGEDLKVLAREKLAGFIEQLDETYGINSKLCPDAVETVFGAPPARVEDRNGVMVGDRLVTPSDLAILKKSAARQHLSKEAMDAVDSFDIFAASDPLIQAAVVAFIPRVKK